MNGIGFRTLVAITLLGGVVPAQAAALYCSLIDFNVDFQRCLHLLRP